MSYRQGMDIASIHVFVGGEGRETTFDQIDVAEHPSATELKTAVELHLDLAAGLLRNYEVEGYESTGQVVLRPDAKLGADVEDELTVRGRVFNSLLNCPHREMGDILALHSLLLDEDPEFYAHFAVWAMRNTKVRDHKEAFIATLFSSEHSELREVAYVLLQSFPAYQIARIRGHVEGGWSLMGVRVKKTSSAAEKAQAKAFRTIKKAAVAQAEAVPGNADMGVFIAQARTLFKLKRDTRIRARFYRGRSKDKDGVTQTTNRVRFEHYAEGTKRHAPRIMKSAVKTFLRKLEADEKRFDRDSVRQYKALRELYARFRIRPSETADLILFKDQPPEGTKRHSMRLIARETDPVEWAKAVVSADIPFPIAAGLCPTELTPVHLVALINQMSSAELLNNIGALEARGAMENAAVKKLISEKLKKAQKGKRVDALKAQQAVKVVGARVSADLAAEIQAVTDAQVSRGAKIKRKTLLAIDTSSSMDRAIGVGKELGAMIAPCCTSDFMLASFAAMPKRHEVTDTSKKSAWDEALKFVKASGRTNIGALVKLMERSEVPWEQIILVTDEGDNGTPKFSAALNGYRERTGNAPNVVIVRLNSTSGRASDIVEKGLRHYDFEVDVFDLTKTQKADGTVDYASLPNILPMLAKGSRTELLMDIMDIPLPTRAAWEARANG